MASPPNLYDPQNAFGYPISLTTKEGDVKLAKLPFFKWKCDSNNQPRTTNDIDLFISGYTEESGGKVNDAVVVNSVCGDDENYVHEVVWTCQIFAHWDFLLSLQYNYTFGKVYFLLEWNGHSSDAEDGEVAVFVVVRSECFRDYLEPDDLNVNFDYRFRQGYTHDRPNNSVLSLKPVMRTLFKLQDECVQENYGKTRKLNIADMYEHVKRYHEAAGDTALDLRYKFQHKHLLPSLRNYQAHAVRWMISREREITGDEIVASLHPAWEELVCSDGEKVYFSTYTGGLSKTKPLASPSPKGGILAEEMGLGKTVEVLACVLNNPPPRKHVLKRDGCVDGALFGPPVKKTKMIDLDTQKNNEHSNTNNEKSPLAIGIIETSCNEMNQQDKTDLCPKCSCMRLLDDYFQYKLGSDMGGGESEVLPCSCECGVYGVGKDGEQIETSMTEMECYFNKKLMAERFEFVRDREHGGDQELYVLLERGADAVGHLNDGGGSEKESDVRVEDSYVDGMEEGEDKDETEESVEEGDRSWCERTRRAAHNTEEEEEESDDDTMVQWYQSADYPRKISAHVASSRARKIQVLKNVANDHSNYEKPVAYQTYFADYYAKCCMCSDNIKALELSCKVQCKSCTNVVHRECAGTHFLLYLTFRPFFCAPLFLD